MNSDAGFLQDIVAHPNDPVPRLIYADWLDEHDDPRGEFLRLEVQLKELKEDDPKHEKIRARLQELRKGFPRTWLALLDRTDVENCGLEFSFKCPRRWEDLETTGNDTVRFCDDCRKHVHHCGSIGEARRQAGLGKCIAVDSRLTRQPGDIQPPVRMMTMGVLLPRISESPEPEEVDPGEERQTHNRESRRRGKRRNN